MYSPLPGDAIEAARISERHQISMWDAMIVRAAAQAGCEQLWSEDLNHGQRIEGVEIVNPFV